MRWPTRSNPDRGPTPSAQPASRYDDSMIAANPWHWWIGVVLALASGGALVSVIVGYVTKVSGSRYPGRRKR